MASEFLHYLFGSSNIENVILYDERGEYTYSDFQRIISGIQVRLENVGFPKKSNVIVYMDNRIEAIATIIAIFRCGLVAVPVSFSLPDSLFEQYVKHIDAVAYISIDDNEKTKINVLDANCKNYNNSNTSLILFTSGTTGKLKAVELSESGLVGTISAVVEYMKCDSTDCFFVIKDYVHCSCLISEIFVGLVTGSKICIYNPRLPFSILRKKIKEHNVTIMGVNPWILEMICKQPLFIEYYKSIRLLISSGSVLSDKQKVYMAELLSFAQIINVYGLTEACSRVCAQVPGFNFDNLSVGKTIKNVSISLKSYDNENYEILVKSPGNMLGYYNDVKSTNEKLVDGWILTGDIGYLDGDDNLIVLGRKDDLILCASNKIDPNHVDNVIRQFPGVKDACTIGLPDSLLGEKVVSVIEYDMTWSQEVYMEIQNYCKQHLLPYERPSKVVSISHIPRTVSGKVLKQEIRNMLING